MKKYVRENKGIKISRDISYLSSRIDRLIELLCQKYKRMPTTKELSIEVGIEEWKIIEALNMKSCIKSLDEKINTDGKDIMVIDTIPIEDNDNTMFQELMDSLDKNEKTIILKRYIYDKNQSEVAKSIGYSQAKVSREEQKILKKLKNYYS